MEPRCLVENTYKALSTALASCTAACACVRVRVCGAMREGGGAAEGPAPPLFRPSSPPTPGQQQEGSSVAPLRVCRQRVCGAEAGAAARRLGAPHWRRAGAAPAMGGCVSPPDAQRARVWCRAFAPVATLWAEGNAPGHPHKTLDRILPIAAVSRSSQWAVAFEEMMQCRRNRSICFCLSMCVFRTLSTLERQWWKR